MTRPIIHAIAMVAALSAFSLFGCGPENDDPVPDGSTLPQARFGAADAGDGGCVPYDPPPLCEEATGGDRCEENFGPGWRCDTHFVFDTQCGWSAILSACVPGAAPDAG